MSRDGFRGPKLPKQLLDQVQSGNGTSRKHREILRKDGRKAERQQQKKGASLLRRTGVQTRFEAKHKSFEHDSDPGDGKTEPASTRHDLKDSRQLKSILKTAKPSPKPGVDHNTVISHDASDDGDSDGSFTISRSAAKAGLADEDAEITALEKRLGMRSKKSKSDDLDWLQDASDSEAGSRGVKRKRPEDVTWLRGKRLRARGVDMEDDGIAEGSLSGSSGRDDDSEDDLADDLLDDAEFAGHESGTHDREFEGFESSDEEPSHRPHETDSTLSRQRENPYVAPVSQETTLTTTKYVPPSLRKPAGNDEDELLKQLRRQIQGQLNRLSEANLLSILQNVEESYEKNARQGITSIIIELLTALVSDASTLNDAYLILHAGFAAAVYRVVGTDFGAHLVEHLVETLDGYRDSTEQEGKQRLNLLAFMASLYTFQVIGSRLIFDFIRALLDEISEPNTELLLRIIRTSGVQLRQDDPSALKDIVLLLQRSVASMGGEEKLSVRTKFMIETIHNLKNNRLKNGSLSALSAEHTTRMRKVLGSLSTRSIKATEPLRISLTDIRNSDKRGKWWLVGASYHDHTADADGTNSALTSSKHANDIDSDAGYDSETPGHVNLHRLAKQQGMNTDVRRAIFITIMSSSDFQDAQMRLLKLRLKRKQEMETPRVILHCVQAEAAGRAWNPYYALVASRLCTAHTGIKKAFGFLLWDALGRIEEQDENDEEDDNSGGGRLNTKQLIAVAKFYGWLIADGSLSITVLKKMEFAYLTQRPTLALFAEVLLTTLFKRLRAAAKKEKHGRKEKGEPAAFENAVREAFRKARDAPPDTISGLRHFIHTTMAKAQLASGVKETEMIKTGCGVASAVLDSAAEEEGRSLVNVDGDQEDAEESD